MQALVLRDRLAELLSRFGIIECGLEPRLRDADGECRDTDTPLVERAHHDVEAAIERSQQRICAKPDLIEMQRSHRRGALAHFLFFLAARHTILVEIDDEDGHAAIAEGGIGARQHVGEIGNGRIVNPHLGAGKPEARSVALSRRPDTGNVGAGLGSYGYRETSEFSDAGENVDTRHSGTVLNGGAEFRLHRWVGLGADVQYTHVPGILGLGGVSQQAGENDLGGVAVRVKLVVGR